MKKKLGYIILILSGVLSYGQQCPILTEPLNGAADVPVDTQITWNDVEGDVGYVISLGTSPGAGDIINQRSSGQLNYYIPEVGLPESTTVYVTIKLFVFGQGELICASEVFETEDVTVPPACTTLNLTNQISGTPSSQNVIRWNYAPKATGYRISVGTNQTADNIIAGLDVGNVLSFDLTGMLNNDSELFVLVVPYNENGDAPNCSPEGLTIDTSAQFCEPYFDSSEGGIVDRKPHIEIPAVIAICGSGQPTMVTGEGVADGFRWFKMNDDGSEVLISENPEIPISTIGRYRYEAYNNYSQAMNTIECSTSGEFNVIMSEPANIREIITVKNGDTRTLEVIAEGTGDYEYALDDANGPYQPNRLFTNVVGDRHTIYVRDINGCGVVSQQAPRDLSTDNFPSFFTPNEDNTNDTWQFIPTENVERTGLAAIYIFDRYGNLLAQIDPSTSGWDGRFRGKPLPSSTYWYRAVAVNGDEVKGYFALKR